MSEHETANVAPVVAATAAANTPQEDGLLDEAITATTTHRKGLVEGAAEQLGVAPDKLCNLLRTVWTQSRGQPALTDAEMFVGISLVARFELDPVAKEVYVIRTSKGLATIVALDGWVKILLRTDYYDGHEQETDWEDDAHTTAKSIKTTIHSKEHKYPTIHVGYRKEYDRVAGVVNKSMPLHMLGIHSLKHAARKFVPLGGSVLTEEEAAYLNREHAPADVHSHVELAMAAADADATLAEPTVEKEPEPVHEDGPAGFDRTARIEAFRKFIDEADGNTVSLVDIKNDIEADPDLGEEDRASLHEEAEAATKQP